ncbi:RsiV family protein [Oceanicella actignis]|uniref:DUF3298 domain-containing protein n=1 Tax=Oceanicella actignis TaxID=1189325 RepID=A0A1M7TNW7_9RHOB|nr:RsiV family protein [Oceanicella actignis]SET73222.1 hypothetical protein SAMN04488119_10889 [Oceanicella actignis]SHN72444.1 hypothetical protein SAMN05216200_10890 [Oceanicella actignis]
MARVIRAAALAAVMAAAAGGAGAAPAIVVAEGGLKARIDATDTLAGAPDLMALLDEENAAILAEARARAAEPGAAPISLRITLAPAHVGPRFASALRTVALQPAAGPAELFLDPISWDRATGRILRLDALLAPGRPLREGLARASQSLRAALGALPDVAPQALDAATVPDAAVLQAFTLAPSDAPGRIGGLIFHFAPGELGPDAAARQVAIPQAVLGPWLRPELRALFAGAPTRDPR